MPRSLRSNLPGGVYHVTTRGVAGTFLFRDDDDRRLMLSLLAGTADRFHWCCLAFCLMGNHYHLVIQASRSGLSAGMQRLNGVYAQAFNQRHGRSGHLFGARFTSRLVGGDEHARRVCTYVLDNPLRAGLAVAAGDWPWSGSRYGRSA